MATKPILYHYQGTQQMSEYTPAEEHDHRAQSYLAAAEHASKLGNHQLAKRFRSLYRFHESKTHDALQMLTDAERGAERAHTEH